MLTPRVLAAVALAGLIGLSAPVRPAAAPQDDLDTFVIRIQEALQAGDAAAYRALVLAPDEAAAREMAEQMVVPDVTRVTVKDRDRLHLTGSLPGEGYELLLEILTERGRRGLVTSWRVAVRLARLGADPAARAWRIVEQSPLSSVRGLYRLDLDPSRQFTVRDLVVTSTDLRLHVPSGDAFVAEMEEGVTVLVVLGRGEMRFTPPNEAERSQLKLFSGAEALVAPFDGAYLRLSPGDPLARVGPPVFVAKPVDPRTLRRAREIFAQHVGQSLSLSLGDLSRETWSLPPGIGDLIAEVHTRKFGVLTYARSFNESEDVSLFDRATRRNLSSYASPQKLRVRGRFYSEDDLNDYDVLDYNIDASFTPAREWIEGRAVVRLRVRDAAVSTITLHLDGDLAVRSVTAAGLGRLMYLRVIGQNNLIVNLPAIVERGHELELTIAYGGRLRPQVLDREAIRVGQDQQATISEVTIPPELFWVYSNRTHWYPRSVVNDYATSTLRITVPAEYDCVATGLQAVGSPTTEPARLPGGSASRAFVFIAGQPVRYLGVIVSRFETVERTTLELELDAETGPPTDTQGYSTVDFSILSHARQQSKGRSLREPALNILRYYASVLGDAPYPAFTLTVTDSLLPGGHSPAYFAVLNQPLPTTPYRWQNDPVSFDNFPAFFLAHEIAHQWWGQAVGWENYHEQWLSEGISQYFAALYAQHMMGDALFNNLMRQMRRWSMRYTDQGPVHLGYRVGHVRGDSRVFRAIVYNKAAVVLHMLRRLVGDEKFFAGFRRFYRQYRFRKAGTDDLRRVMEQESGLSLERFFERWIHGSSVPTIRFSSQPDNTADPAAPGRFVALRFEQMGEVFDVPVTVTFVYASGARRSIVIPLAEAVTTRTVPVEYGLVRVEVNEDQAALAEFVR
jgi:hypothetical protein